jgi:hypothetical protein
MSTGVKKARIWSKIKLEKCIEDLINMKVGTAGKKM